MWSQLAHVEPPRKCPFPKGEGHSGTHLMHGSTCQSESMSRTVPRSVHPFWRARARNYECSRCALFPAEMTAWPLRWARMTSSTSSSPGVPSVRDVMRGFLGCSVTEPLHQLVTPQQVFARGKTRVRRRRRSTENPRR